MRTIYDRYYNSLCIIALNYLDSFDGAEDVVQEVLTDFWIRHRGTTFCGSLRAYLFQAVRNASLNALRNSKRNRFDDIEEHISTLLTAEPEELRADMEQLQHDIDQLPERCGEVFRLITEEGLKYREVAERLNISINTVKMHYSRALKALRKHLALIVLICINVL